MKTLFGTSGVRGIFGEDLTLELCYEVAKSLSSLLAPGARVCLATDTRVSREDIKKAIFSGLLSCGTQVTDLGILPTPALALLTREWGYDTGIMVTASHNPPEFNGIKLFNGDSLGYSREQEQQIEKIYFEKSFRRNGSEGNLSQRVGMGDSYRQFIEGILPHVNLNKRLRVVVDPGNGAASGFASTLFTEMGLEVLPINDNPDGLFPGRNPEPKEDTLYDTVRFLRERNADLACCFDGDADRVVFCDREGFLGFNEMIAFISRLAIEDSGKKIAATTVETGKLLDLAIEDLGGEVIRGKVGDVYAAHLARDNDAAIGVESVGVYILPEAGYYPESIYASLLLLSKIKDVTEIRDFFKKLPKLYFDKRKIACPNHFKEAVIGKVKENAHLPGVRDINSLDGLRFEFENSWMLIRASGTEPAVRVIAESMSAEKTQELLHSGEQLVLASLEGAKQ
jgi:phosphoglucosamine mutase